MDNKQLTLLAAKAAGIAGLWDGYAYVFVPSDGPLHWDPLHDDGDALRLAVKFGLGAGVLLSLCASGPAVEITGNESQWEKWGEDPYAATRRAIVRAAAEIGKGM